MHPVRKPADELPEAIRHLHDEALVPGKVVKEWWRTLHRPTPEVVTTTWLAKNVGMSAEWWADACRRGDIEGAWQESEGSPWYLPYAAARRHLLRVQNRAFTPARSTRRGPRKDRRKAS